jgi:hypothetical protein
MCNKGHERSVHKELNPTRQTRDTQDVNKILDILDQCQNPFDLETVPTRLVQIKTGRIANQAVEESLCEFLQKGNDYMKKITEERLVNGSASFWDPISRTKIVTFTNVKKPLQISADKNICIDSVTLFRRLLSVSSHRDVNMRQVLQHEMAPIPPALFYDDGTMRKTCKSDLATKLEATIPEEIYNLPTEDGNTAYVIDGMALIHSLNDSLFTTFEDLAERILKKVVSVLQSKQGITNVTIVFDRYDIQHSIKSMERRGAGCGIQTHEIALGRTVPCYRSFLESACNKAALACLVTQYIVGRGPDCLDDDESIVLAGGYSSDGAMVTCI